MPDTHKIAILGCGDYLRWEHENIRRSKRVRVKLLYDPATERAEHYAEFFDARVAPSSDAIFADEEVSVVLIFTPPHVRKDLVKQAVKSGKHIITVKPLAPTLEEATGIVMSVREPLNCAVFYRRTGNAQIETLKKVFDSGEIGRLALFREDWLHHYPTWNRWALEPEKNGGPFMDAMIHNLNIARYLASCEAGSVCFFSDSLAHDLPCSDTDCMKVNFKDGAAAYLFITWAADLEIYDPSKNDREHIDIFYMVSDQGWHVTLEGNEVRATREGKVKTWPVEPLARTPYDDFVEALESGTEQPCSLVDAWRDIAILEQGMRQPGRTVGLDITPPV